MRSLVDALAWLLCQFENLNKYMYVCTPDWTNYCQPITPAFCYESFCRPVYVCTAKNIFLVLEYSISTISCTTSLQFDIRCFETALFHTSRQGIIIPGLIEMALVFSSMYTLPAISIRGLLCFPVHGWHDIRHDIYKYIRGMMTHSRTVLAVPQIFQTSLDTFHHCRRGLFPETCSHVCLGNT